MGHHLLGGFKRRFRHGDHQIADAAAAEGNLFNQADEFQRDLFCSRMRAEIDAVARRQHADAVVDDGLRRVGARRDRPDNAKRRILKQHHAAVAGQRGGGEVFHARRVVQRGLVFQVFVFFVAHSRFIGALFRQRGQQRRQLLTHCADDGAAGF